MQYMGSKNRFAKEIVPIIQKYIDENNIRNYLEPFVGGANIIDKINCNKRIGCDLNEYLIELLKYTSTQKCLPIEIDDFECIWQKETKANFDSNRNSNDDKNVRVEKLFKLRQNHCFKGRE